MEEGRSGEVLIISKTIVQLRFYLDCRDSFQVTLSLSLSLIPTGGGGSYGAFLQCYIVRRSANTVSYKQNCPITPGIPSLEGIASSPVSGLFLSDWAAARMRVLY